MGREVTVSSVRGTPMLHVVSVGPHRWESDDAGEFGGTDRGPAAMELLLGALGVSTAQTLRMYADMKNWPLDGIEVRLTHEPLAVPAGPKVLVRRHIRIRGTLDGRQRRRLLEVADRSPAYRSLTVGVRMSPWELETG